MSQEYAFNVETGYTYKHRSTGPDARILNWRKVKDGTSVLVSSDKDRAKIVASLRYHALRYPEEFGDLRCRSVPVIDEATGEKKIRVFFIDKNKL
jgi:hypothetical protein